MESKRWSIKVVAFLFALFSCGPAVASDEDAGKTDFAVIAYYSGDGSDIERYPLEKLTHLIYSFLHLQGNKLAVDSGRDDLTIQKLVSLKEIYPNLKIMLALGGWGGCETCSEVFASQAGRREFVASAESLLRKYQADGLDLDWEYPAIAGPPGHPFSPEDRRNFTLLVRELREAFGEQFELSFAAGGFTEYLQKSVEWSDVMPLVERVNLMTYDLVNGYSTVTGHHTPLHASKDQKESVQHAVAFLDSLGVPRSKMVIGAAFYARTWEKVAAKNNGLYQAGVFKDFVHYRDFETYFSEVRGFTQYYDSLAGASYRYSTKEKLFATFDDAASVRAKTIFAIRNGLGGIMFWQLSADKYNGGLLDAIDQAVRAIKPE